MGTGRYFTVDWGCYRQGSHHWPQSQLPSCVSPLVLVLSIGFVLTAWTPVKKRFFGFLSVYPQHLSSKLTDVA